MARLETPTRWREQTGEACSLCAGAGVLDEGEKGHGACPRCRGSGEEPEEADARDDPESGP